jgi:peptide/nickel transport system substrate-binding protein
MIKVKRHWSKVMALAGVAAMASFALAACGSSSSSSSSGQQGGSITTIHTKGPDYLDPQLAYTVDAWTAEYNVYLPLVTYAHAEGQAGTKIVPGLAEDLPKITNGGKTYTFTLRKGLKYSDGTDVKASDFQSTVQRLFDVDSGGAPFFSTIVGATDYQSGKANSISGIKTDDKTGEIQINLTEPNGSLLYELAIPFTAMVPPNTPAKDQTPNPPPSTGPYTISASDPGHSWVLTRNPEWEKNNSQIMPDIPSGHLDKITEKVLPNQASGTTQVEQNKADLLYDPPPTDLLGSVQSKYGDRFAVENTVSTYYFWMNTAPTTAGGDPNPFSDLKVRQAVNYAVDPTAVGKLYGGLLSPTQQVLPSDMAGYQKIELYPHNLNKAKQLIAQANLSPAEKNITVWTDDVEPNSNVGQYYQSVLQDLGFNAKLNVVNGQTYFTTLGNLKTPKLNTGFSDWYQDFPHPNDFFQPLLSGESIHPTNNNNYAQLDDPAINKKISDLAQQQLTPDVESQYAALDKQVMEQAPWAPYGARQLSLFTSDRLNFDNIIWSPVFDQDYSSFELK